MFPPVERLCHRTGFAKSCRKLVESGKCGLWVSLDCEDKGGTKTQIFTCLDNTVVPMLSTLQGKLGAVETQLEALREESKQRDTKRMAIDVQVLGTVMDATQRIKLAGEAIEDARQLDHRQEQLALTAKV